MGDRRLGQKEPFEQKKISAFTAFVAIRGRWRVPGRPDTVRDHQGPPGIDILVKRNRLSKKKNFVLCGLEAAGGSRGGPTLSGTTRDRRLGQKEPFEPKKEFRPLRPLWPLEAAGGSQGGPTLSGTIRDHQGSTFWSKETV